MSAFNLGLVGSAVFLATPFFCRAVDEITPIAVNEPAHAADIGKCNRVAVYTLRKLGYGLATVAGFLLTCPLVIDFAAEKIVGLSLFSGSVFILGCRVKAWGDQLEVSASNTNHKK
jgi:hypothetical protein